MGALAVLLHEAGHEVRGSDSELYPPMSTLLRAAGIPVATGYRDQNLEWEPDFVVVGNICSRDHPEVVAAQARGLKLESFPSMLEKTLLADRRPLVVAGTHGKTTTTAALAWMLEFAGQDPSYLIGGVPLNLESGARLGSGEAFVLEGDEYDTAFFDKRSKFLHYRPARACLSSVEFDHADIFSDIDAVRAAFREFVAQIPPSGELVARCDDEEVMAVAAAAKCRIVTYRVVQVRDQERDRVDVGSADYCAVFSSRPGVHRTTFELFEHGRSLGVFASQLFGGFNVANVVAAIALARLEGVEVEPLRDAVRCFRGVRRRQELAGIAQGVRIVEDFAHHPTAVRLSVNAVRRRHHEQVLHVCFEPRSASSRRRVFFEPYSEAFDAADHVYLGPLYRPDKIPEAERLDVRELGAAISKRGVSVRAFADVDALAAAVLEAAGPGDTILVMSCGSFGGLTSRLLFGFGDPLTFGTTADAPAIDALLASYDLPPVARSGRVETLVIRAMPDDLSSIVGCVCLEFVGDCAVLFGLAVTPDRRREGLGWVLGDAVMRRARTLGARLVYLLTGTAADFFASKLGFSQIDVDAVDPAVRTSENFRASAELPNAVCMVCALPVEDDARSG
jgi:UDP-N-acetylmuramate: L-alanyl-gamma-D-glutamyl-meso-diaminopimelate ligase